MPVSANFPFVLFTCGAPDNLSREKIFVKLVDKHCRFSKLRDLNMLLTNKEKLWGFLVVRICLDKSQYINTKCSVSGQCNLRIFDKNA